MAGIEVSRQGIDQKVGETLLMLRQALDKAHSVAMWLANTPVPQGGPDPLVSEFNYTDDEAYLMRLVFQQVDQVRTDSSSLEDNARKLTGLE